MQFSDPGRVAGSRGLCDTSLDVGDELLQGTTHAHPLPKVAQKDLRCGGSHQNPQSCSSIAGGGK